MYDKDMMPSAAVRRRPAGRVRPLVVVLAIGLLMIAGCAAERGKPSPTDARRIGMLMVPDDNPTQNAGSSAHADDPPAVLFVAYVETPQDIVERMLKMAKVTEDDVVCDLGCGDGRIVVTAAKRYGCRAIGYDLDPLRVEEARKNAERNGVADLVTIEQKDVLTADLQGVSVVTIYMGTEMNTRLIPQLSRLKAGARIVSHDFGIGEIPPDRTVEVASRYDDRKHKIHLWRCPLRANPTN